MSTTRILAAVSLALALSACSGQQQAEGTAAEPAAGEMPQAGDTGTVTGSPATDTYGADTAATETPPVSTSADASAMGEDTLQPVDPTTGTGDQPQDPLQQTDPALEDATSDPQQSATPPPPTQ
jgi:hypothetical protein